MAVKRNINYINRDFDSFRDDLITLSKTYFPNTYNDFTPSSTGMLFIEMAAYVGDVLSFYLDNQLQETFIQHSRQENNLYNLAYLLGYSPKVTTPSNVLMDIYQQVPAIVNSLGETVPDFSYSLLFPPGIKITSNQNSNLQFLINDKVDFSYSSSLSPTDVSVYTIAGNTPTMYLLKKQVKAISANLKTTSYTFSSPQRFQTVSLNSSNIIGIYSISDSEGNPWYEVDNLAQETIYDSIANTDQNDPNYGGDNEVPYLLKLKQVQRRFVTRFINSSLLQIQFGSGTVLDTDELVIPNPDNVGIGLPFEQDKLTTAFSPTNFIFNDTYGISPSNTTLTVTYLTGGGVGSNSPAGTLTSIDVGNVKFINNNLTGATSNIIFNSIAVTNTEAARGGSDGDDIEELRKNSLGNFQNQLRTVTQDDYLIRALSMPSIYGALSKAYAAPENLQDLMPGEIPAVVQLYVLGYNNNGDLADASIALKQNLKTYLSQYRIINDSVKIKNAYVINFDINFDIIVLPNYSNTQILNNCILALQNYFRISKWQINQPILLKDLYILLDKVVGVQTVKNIELSNKTGISNGYSDYAYDIKGATIDNTVYPSIDPMIFELKYPSTDVKGRVVPL